MKNRHVKDSFLDWHEDRVSEGNRQRIQRHLEKCPECRSYYLKMQEVLENPAAHWLPRLEPDPYLPTRIKTLARTTGTPSAGKKRFAFHWAISVVLVMLALLIGIYLGKGLATENITSEEMILSSYYQALPQSDLAENWEYVLTSQEEDGQ